MNIDEEITKLNEEGDVLVDRLQEMAKRLDYLKTNKVKLTFAPLAEDTRPLVYWKKLNPKALPMMEVYAKNNDGLTLKGYVGVSATKPGLGIVCETAEGQHIQKCTQYIEGYLLAELDEGEGNGATRG